MSSNPEELNSTTLVVIKAISYFIAFVFVFLLKLWLLKAIWNNVFVGEGGVFPMLQEITYFQAFAISCFIGLSAASASLTNKKE